MTAPTPVETRAASLPAGSVVLAKTAAWVKGGSTWSRTGGGDWTDRDVDSVLAEGATVVRVGTGS